MMPRKVMATHLATVLIAALLLDPASASRASTPPGPGPAWFPAGTKLVVRIRYSDGRTSALFRKLAVTKPYFRREMAHVERFAAATGIDLVRDLDLAWIGADGSEGGQSVAFLLGRLDLRAIAASLEKNGGVLERRAGSDARTRPRPVRGDSEVPELALYTLSGTGKTQPASPEKPARSSEAAVPAKTTVALLTPGIVVAGSPAWVRLALDLGAARGARAPRDAEMAGLLGKIDEGASVWAGAAGAAVAAKVQSQLESGGYDNEAGELVRMLAASFRITEDVRVEADASCASDEDASLLELTLRGILAVAAFRARADDPDMARLLRDMHVEHRSGGVKISTRVPAAVAARY